MDGAEERRAVDSNPIEALMPDALRAGLLGAPTLLAWALEVT